MSELEYKMHLLTKGKKLLGGVWVKCYQIPWQKKDFGRKRMINRCKILQIR